MKQSAMIQEKYKDGHHCFDQLKDYVQTSLSVTQNIQQTRIVPKVEYKEDIDQSEIEIGENLEDEKLKESDGGCDKTENIRSSNYLGKS